LYGRNLWIAAIMNCSSVKELLFSASSADRIYNMTQYIYGPVPSKRLGQSLGVDTIPSKTCNWNCVYCQLGRTRPMVHELREYIPAQDILDQVQQALDAHQPGEIDWITFVGSGEPALHSGLGELIRGVKQICELPVAVITNGSLLYLPEVREALLPVDAVLPSLDAGTAELYKRINRPHPQATFKRLLEGLIAFREEYRGKLWVEVMLVRGLNDTREALEDLAKVLRRVRPDEVHINLPTRPPAETWVQPPTEESQHLAGEILGDTARLVQHTVEGTFDLGEGNDLVEAVMGIIQRHPMREDQLERTLSQWAPGEVKATLTALEASGRANMIERYGERFWGAATGGRLD
jgi:wyosine [tRNA(Phe)-imidazoG37] synthetase (radical SAM superfamily)